MNGLGLFVGILGIDVALEAFGIRPVAYCEKDQFSQAVILSRQVSGDVPVAPIWDNVLTLRGSMLPRIDAIFGGFPCQDISLAGSRAGLGGKRSGLFFEIVRLAEECQAAVIVLENVWPGVGKFVPTIRAALKELGFQCRDGHLAARDVGANHIRERWFLVATHPDRLRQALADSDYERELQSALPREGFGLRLTHGCDLADAGCGRLHSTGEGQDKLARGTQALSASEDAPDTAGIRCDSLGPEPVGWAAGLDRAGILSDSDSDSEGLAIREGESIDYGSKLAALERDDWWASEPPVGRVVDGFPDKLARARHVCELHALGNACVPKQGRAAITRLRGITNN